MLSVEHQLLSVDLQAIHHKVHFLINSSLQACQQQDASKQFMQSAGLQALCCSLQILEVQP